MKNGKVFTCLFISFILTFGISQTALSVVIKVNNPGFEDNKLSSGGNVASANGWLISGTAGTFYPNSAAFPDLAPQGNNVAYADVATLSQIIPESLAANTVYSLIVEVGDRANIAFVSYSVKLYAGGMLLASATAPTPPNGGFVTAAVNYDVQPGDPSVGQILSIELTSGGAQTLFDCIRLVKLTDPILNLTQGTRFASIQAAIYAAVDGDVIEVPSGTYYEHINFFGKQVTLTSRSGDPDDTIIDGKFIDLSSGSIVVHPFKGSVISCKTGENEDTVIEGFTICNGLGTYSGGYRYGGGMYNWQSSPTVTDCIFTANSVTGDGGGMYNTTDSSPTVTGCAFTSNYAAFAGGGMDNRVRCSPAVTDCTFSQNTALTNGGGMENFNNSSPTVTNCTFMENRAQNSGGGMYNENNSSPIVADSTFAENITYSYDGGAAYNNTGTAKYTRCLFESNVANRYGGAVINNNSVSNFLDCTFIANSTKTEGGAVMNYNSSARYTGCTFTRNTSNNGGAMFNRLNSSPVVLDCIFDYNVAGNAGGAIYDYEGTENPMIAYSQFLGNHANASTGGAVMHSSGGTPRMNHCLLIGNYAKTYGGGLYVNAGTIDIQHCTFTANKALTRGGGIFLATSGTMNIINTIAWGNTSPTGADIRQDSGTLTTSYSNFGIGMAGQGNLIVDPNFVVIPGDGGDGWGDDPTTPAFDESTNDNFGNVRLAEGSPCIDAANSLFTGSVDMDGNIRAVDDADTPDTGIGPVTFLDMGVYEYGSIPPSGGILGDLNNDNKVNLEDFRIMAQNWMIGI